MKRKQSGPNLNALDELAQMLAPRVRFRIRQLLREVLGAFQQGTHGRARLLLQMHGGFAQRGSVPQDPTERITDDGVRLGGREAVAR